MTATAATPEAPSAPPAAAAKTPGRGKFIALFVLLAFAAGGGAYYNHSRNFEATDDPQVDGDISAVSAKVSGNLRAVLVKENQRVNAGDVIAEIDRLTLSNDIRNQRLNQVNADLAQLRAEIEALPEA